MPIDNAELARVGEQARNLERNMDMDRRENNEKFERVFRYIKEEFVSINSTINGFDVKLESRLKPTEDKMTKLWDEHNKKEGAFGFGKWVAGGIGGAIGALATLWGNTHGGSQP